MNMTSKYLSSLIQINFPIKIFAVFVSFIAPLASVIHVIVLLLVVDAVTSIYYQMKMVASKTPKGKRFIAAISVIESGKLKKTLEKMFFYILMLIVFYSFDLFVLKIEPVSTEAIHTFSITNLAAVLISIVELTSIASNVSKITGNPVFDRIIKIFSKKVDKKFEIEDADSDNRETAH